MYEAFAKKRPKRRTGTNVVAAVSGSRAMGPPTWSTAFTGSGHFNAAAAVRMLASGHTEGYQGVASERTPRWAVRGAIRRG
ncbi:MAG TPA: hypothetical protein VFA63_15590, partial [Pseudonocardiaceae bacterium]|nr:hypothetical protein [Pseudonocardiaceae bacterium]